MNEDLVIRKLMELDQKVGALATQDSVDGFRGEVTTTLDMHTSMLRRLDQERVFTFERVKRIEDDVQGLKSRLGIA